VGVPTADTTKADPELIAAVRDGDDRAFEELYARHRPRVVAHVDAGTTTTDDSTSVDAGATATDDATSVEAGATTTVTGDVTVPPALVV